jgi:hypothetical protein
MLNQLCLQAQFLDTLHHVFRHYSSIDARLESRYSFIHNDLSSVTGLRLGVAFQRKLRIGGGISWLKTDHRIPLRPVYENGTRDSLTRFLKLGYLCFYIDFVFHRTKRWQLSVPIQGGIGNVWLQRYKSYDYFGSTKKQMMFLYEPGITAQFKIFKWLGLGSDIAYRFTFMNDRKLRRRHNGLAPDFKALPWTPTYSFKLLIWFDQLYYVMFPESKITKRFGPSFW